MNDYPEGCLSLNQEATSLSVCSCVLLTYLITVEGASQLAFACWVSFLMVQWNLSKMVTV